MSRRKQAFPVRVEGNRPHVSADSGPSCIQKSSEPIACDSNIADKEAHSKPPNFPSSELVSSAAHEEPKTSVSSCEEPEASGSVHSEQCFSENKTKKDILSSIKVIPSTPPEDSTAVTSACSGSVAVKEEEEGSCAVKEELYTFRVDEKEEKPRYESSCHTDHEFEKNPEICRDLNVRTSLVCKAGTEIKVIQNFCAKKEEVECVVNLPASTFEIHKKPLKKTEESSYKNNSIEIIEQDTSQDGLESKETAFQGVLPCAAASDKESDPQVVLPCIDYAESINESSVPTSPTNERQQCEMVVSSPEPDSDTILLDESDLNIPDEGACVGSSHILSDAEVIVTGDIYNEPTTGVLVDDEALPPIKVEPCIILKEEQEPLNIPSCIDSSGHTKDEELSTFPSDYVKQAINIQELEPQCLTHGVGQCGCKNITESSETCNDLPVRSPVIRRLTRQSARAEKEGIQKLTELTKNASKTTTKQLEKIAESLHEDCSTGEQGHTCTSPKNILGHEDSPLEAILPCVDIDLSLLKEGEQVVISSCKSPVIEESSFSSFPSVERVINTLELKPLSLSHVAAQYVCKGSESAVGEECKNLNVKTHTYRTRNKANRNSYAENSDTDSDVKPKGNTPKTGRKCRQKTRASRRSSRTPQTKEPNQVYTEPKESHLQAILPCVDVDPSLLKDETEPALISTCKDLVPNAPETSKTDTQSILMELSCDEDGKINDESRDSSLSNLELHIPGSKSSRRVVPCVTDEEIRSMVDFTKEALDQREKKLKQIREAVYKKRSLETEEQRQARLEKDKLRQRKRRAEETDEQREKRLLTMRLHKRIKRSMNSAAGLAKNFLDYYMEEMFKYPETQEEQGSPLNMIVSIDPSWVVRTVEKQQFKCAVETEEQRKTRLEKDMLRQRKKRAEETPEQRAKRLETMRINKRIRRAMETEDQRHRRLEYSRERQLFRRLNETEEQRKERLEREKLRQRQKRASESSEERALRLQAARERMRERLSEPGQVSDIIDNLLSSDSLSS